MLQFKNIFQGLRPKAKVNFDLVAQIRRVKMEREGFRTDYVNWEHYAKVLKAKHAQMTTN